MQVDDFIATLEGLKAQGVIDGTAHITIEGGVGAMEMVAAVPGQVTIRGDISE